MGLKQSSFVIDRLTASIRFSNSFYAGAVYYTPPPEYSNLRRPLPFLPLTVPSIAKVNNLPCLCHCRVVSS